MFEWPKEPVVQSHRLIDGQADFSNTSDLHRPMSDVAKSRRVADRAHRSAGPGTAGGVQGRAAGGVAGVTGGGGT